MKYIKIPNKSICAEFSPNLIQSGYIEAFKLVDSYCINIDTNKQQLGLNAHILNVLQYEYGLISFKIENKEILKGYKWLR